MQTCELDTEIEQTLSTVAVSEKSILFVTGTRADFGKIEPLALEALNAGFNVSFFITGMHMMERYGETRYEVKRIKNANFYEFVNQKVGDGLDLILAKTISGFSDFIHERKPDLVVIHGDRIEALAASITCSIANIPSVHIEGGELSGTIDESLRHCNTKLCTTHFVSSKSARDRVLTLGESERRVFLIGSPELDTHGRDSGVTIDEVKDYYDVPFDQYGIIVFHSVTTETDEIKLQSESLFQTCVASDKQFVVIAPNNDPGSQDIFEQIDKLPAERFKVIPSMRFSYFSELMKNSSIMIGNSSAGVREMPFLGIPSIDIGTRQSNRSSYPSISHCNASDTKRLTTLISMLWGRKFNKSDEFGSGNAAVCFVQELLKETFWQLPVQKYFSDH